MDKAIFNQSLNPSMDEMVDAVFQFKPTLGDAYRIAIEHLHAYGLESANDRSYTFFRALLHRDQYKALPYVSGALHHKYDDLFKDTPKSRLEEDPVANLTPGKGDAVGNFILGVYKKLEAGTLEPLPDAQRVMETTPKEKSAPPDGANGNAPGMQAEHPAPVPQGPATVPDAPQKERPEPRQEKVPATEPPARAVAMSGDVGRVAMKTRRCITDARVVVEEAQRRMRGAGFADVDVTLDGRIHRVDILRSDGRTSSKAGWYIGYGDGVPNIVFGDWRLGSSETVSGADPNMVEDVFRRNPDAIAHVSEDRWQEARREAEEAKRKAEAERAQAAEETARTGWTRYDKASEDVSRCPYLQRKGVLPEGGSSIPGLKSEENGNLLVPVYRNGNFAGVQTVWPDGTKRFQKGAAKKGASFLLAGTTDQARVFLCEGVATALSVWMATGASVLTCFDCGNLPAVAEEIRAGRIPEVQGKAPLIACDNDAYGDTGPDGKKHNSGVEAGIKAARILGCGMYIPSFQDVSGKPTDYNDLHAQGGVEAVRAQLAAEPLSPDAVKKEMGRPCAIGETRVGNGKMFDAVMMSPTARQKLVSEVRRLEQEHLDRMKGSSSSPTDAVEECLRQLEAYAWTTALDKERVLDECRAVLEASGDANAPETVAALWQKYEAWGYSEPVITLTESDGVRLPASLEPSAAATTPKVAGADAKEGSYDDEKERILEAFGGKVVFIKAGGRVDAAQDALALLGQAERSQRSVTYIPGGKNPLIFQTPTEQFVRLKPVLDLHGRRTTALTPQILDLEKMLYELDASGIAWMKYDKRGKKWGRINAPEDLAKAMFSSFERDALPVLEGCIATPVIDLKTGEVSPAPGYDEETGWFSSWVAGWSPMSKYHAVSVLEDALCEFPFKTPVDKAVAVAAVLTAAIRPMLPSAPGIAITAGAAGTGKTCLCSLLNVVNAGKMLPTIDYRENSDELRKSLFALMRGGCHPTVTVDNIPPRAPLDSTFLHQILSGEQISERVLGVSESETIDVSKTLWLFNGNALNLPADITRRLILCVLQRDEESPARHPFRRKNFTRWAEANRTELVTAALSLVSGYIVAGKPKTKGLDDFAGYEDWASIVPGACIWAGYENPLESLETLKAEDSRQEDISRLFDAWSEAYGIRVPISASKIREECFPSKDDFDNDLPRGKAILRDVLADVLQLKSRYPKQRGISDKLKGFVGAVHENMKFDGFKDNHSKIYVFVLAPIEEDDEPPF